MATLNDIKAGDEIAVYSHIVGSMPVKAIVERTTATQVIDEKGRRFMRKSGYQTDCGYFKNHAEPWTTEHDQRIADAAVVAEQRLAFDAMRRDIDRVVSRIGELHSERRPLDPAAIMALQDAVTDATTLIANAMKGVK